jgi:hypothetical protein
MRCMAVSVLAGGVGLGRVESGPLHIYDYPSNLAVSWCAHDE